MKKHTLIGLVLTIIALVSCKTNSKTPTAGEAKVDSMDQTKLPCALPLVPEYVEGDEALYAFINKNLKYPEAAKKNNISGAVLVSFTVLVSGELTDIKVQQSLGYGCDEEAVRIMKLMPKWKPGKYLNKPIDMSYSLAIVFDNK